jgi:hypothetical protein
MNRTFTLSAVVVLSSIVACSSDDAPAPEKKDVGVACSEMCRESGFTSFKKDEQANEVNCFCSVGPASAVVKAESCTKMCSSIGKGSGKPFGATATGNADSCQCD